MTTEIEIKKFIIRFNIQIGPIINVLELCHCLSIEGGCCYIESEETLKQLIELCLKVGKEMGYNKFEITHTCDNFVLFGRMIKTIPYLIQPDIEIVWY